MRRPEFEALPEFEILQMSGAYIARRVIHFSRESGVR